MESRTAHKYQPTNTNDNDDDDDDSNDDISDDETTAMMDPEDKNEIEDIGYTDEEDDNVTPDPEENPTTPPPDESQDPITDPPETLITPPSDEEDQGNTTTPPPPDVAESSTDDGNQGDGHESDGADDVEGVVEIEDEGVAVVTGGDDEDEVAEDVADDEVEGVTAGTGGDDEDEVAEDKAPEELWRLQWLLVAASASPSPEHNVTIEVSAGAGDVEDEKDLPPYGSPPTYEEAVSGRGSGATPSPRVQHTKSYVEAISADDLEWDRDVPVEPMSSIELQEVVLDPGVERRVSPTRAVVEDTSFSTPGAGNLTVPSDARLPTYTGDTWTSSNQPNISGDDDVDFAKKKTLLIYAFSILAATVALLLVILLPLTFSYVEYYQFGMEKGRISGVVQFAKEIYDYGRYAIGPANTFKRYPAWAHMVEFDPIDFYSADGIILQAQMSFQYFIKQDELGLIEQKYDKSYQDIIRSVAEANIKNEAAKYTTVEYLSERAKVESYLHDAIRLKLGGDCCPSHNECIRLAMCHLCAEDQDKCNRGLHVDARFFQMKMLMIPDALTQRFISIQEILEQNEEAVYRQSYQLIVKETELETEQLLNKAAEIATNGTITAQLKRKQGNTTANALRESAHSRGLKLLYDAISVENDAHKSSIHLMRTLERHENLVMGSSYDAYVSLIQGLGDDD